MFDDLRSIADSESGFTDDSDADLESLLQKKPSLGGKGQKSRKGVFLGMTAFQRFVISALLFVLVCMLGIMLVMIQSSTLLY